MSVTLTLLQQRHRMKQLLASQELLFPQLFMSIRHALLPLMHARAKQESVTNGLSDEDDMSAIDNDMSAI